MLVDTNVLLFAIDERSPFHEPTRSWLTHQWGTGSRLGMPMQVVVSFLRLATSSRVFPRPLTPTEACDQMQTWLDHPVAWIPEPGSGHVQILCDLVVRYHLSDKLIPDAELAALGIEHGLAVASADTDFARFTEIRWVNPLAG